MRQIADHFGVGETLIHSRIRECGIKLRGYENARKRPKTFTPEHLAAMREAGKRRRGAWAGANNPHWKGGLTAANLSARSSGAYMEWKRDALALADNKCQACGVTKGTVCKCCGHKTTLHVHHVKSFARHPEYRFDPTNSEVLCSRCHDSRHNGKSRELLERPTASG